MKVEYIEPFLNSVFTVLEAVAACKCERGALAMRKTTFTTKQITIMAGVIGDLEGMAMYGLSMVTAQKIASAMMGAPVLQFDEMALSAVSELGNMITGHATTQLSQRGYRVDITPPSVIKGTNVEILTRTPALVVPISTEYGMVEINISLAECALRKVA